ncbi:MAG: helix-turn-helix transcriptional regulator [Nitrospinae bacterium]|nr:helix-turn-helix transcriptional regulator [Nitrospinota bacterium]
MKKNLVSSFKVGDQLFPILSTIAIIQGKWTLHVLRVLLSGKKRFGEIMSATGINPKTLSSRLKEMEEAGLLKREFFQEVPPRVEYTLTAKGGELGDLINSMSLWGERWKKENDEFFRRKEAPPKQPPKNDFMFID